MTENPLQTLAERPAKFELGGKIFEIDGWSYFQQADIFAIAASLLADPAKLNGFKAAVLSKFGEAADKQQAIKVALPIVFRHIAKELFEVFAITLNLESAEDKQWLNKHLSFDKVVELLQIIWNKNESTLKNSLNLVGQINLKKGKEA